MSKFRDDDLTRYVFLFFVIEWHDFSDAGCVGRVQGIYLVSAWDGWMDGWRGRVWKGDCQSSGGFGERLILTPPLIHHLCVRAEAGIGS